MPFRHEPRPATVAHLGLAQHGAAASTRMPVPVGRLILQQMVAAKVGQSRHFERSTRATWKLGGQSSAVEAGRPSAETMRSRGHHSGWVRRTQESIASRSRHFRFQPLVGSGAVA